jgi:hypothetical protein
LDPVVDEHSGEHEHLSELGETETLERSWEMMLDVI